MKSTNFTNQQAQIMIYDEGGYRVLHCGVNYSPEKVELSDEVKDVILKHLLLKQLAKQKYCDVIISGTLHTDKPEKIVLASLQPC